MEPTIYKPGAYKTPGVYKGTGSIYNGRGVYNDGAGGPPFYVDGPEIEGKKYNAVRINDKIWLAENLDYKFVSIGGSYVPDPNYIRAWYVDNDENINRWNGRKRGLLYTWAAVNYLEENKNNLLPDGWRVPTYNEYFELINFIGSVDNAGKILKKNVDWDLDWTGDNTWGFGIIPAGCFDKEGFRLSNDYAMIWSATLYDYGYAHDMRFNKSNAALPSPPGNATQSGRSLRLVKDV